MKTRKMFKKIMSVVIAVALFVTSFTTSFVANQKETKAAAPTVSIVSVNTGSTSNLRVGEMLEAKVSGYDGDVSELTYYWKNSCTIKISDLYVFDNPDTSKAKEVQLGKNDETKKKGYRWASWTGNIKHSQKLICEVYDGDKKIASTSVNSFAKSNLGKDCENVTIAAFAGDTVSIKETLAANSVVYATSALVLLTQGKVADEKIATETLGYVVTKAKGETTVSYRLDSEACKFHTLDAAEVTSNLKVFGLPSSESTTKSITLSDLDKDCDYYYDGAKLEVKDGKITVEGLQSDTEYTFTAVGKYKSKGKDNTLSKTFKVKTQEPVFCKISYLQKDEDGKPVKDEFSVEQGYVINVDPDGGTFVYDGKAYTEPTEIEVNESLELANPQKKGFMFNGWKAYGTEVAANFDADWLEDANGDEIPDKYQMKITLKIKNGTWDGNDRQDIVEWVTLYDEDGNMDIDGTGSLDVPTKMKANVGFKDGAWDNEVPSTISRKTYPLVYTYKFEAEEGNEVTYTYDVDYSKTPAAKETTNIAFDYNEEFVVDPNGGEWSYLGDKFVNPQTIPVTEDLTIEDATKDGYLFAGWTTLTDGKGKITLSAQWVVDANKTGVPDIYEKAVTYKVVNGTFDGGVTEKTEYVKLYNLLGRLSEDGIGTLDVPNPTADEGYTDGEWDPSLPVLRLVTGNNPVTYTCTYRKAQRSIVYTGTERTLLNILLPVIKLVDYGTDLIVDPNGGQVVIDNISYSFPKTITIKDLVNTIPDPTREGYAFVGYEFSDADSRLVAKWEKDENGDNIPDIYQKKITFKVVNGTWASGKKDDFVVYFTLKDLLGVYNVDGSAPFEIPSGMVPDEGYTEYGYWSVDPMPRIVTNNIEDEYTYTFVIKPVLAVYDVAKIGESTVVAPKRQFFDYGDVLTVDPNGGLWTYEGTTYQNQHDVDLVENITMLPDPVREKMAFAGWSYTTTKAGQKLLTAQWAKDINEDKIPDKYQQVVTFKVENGIWEDGSKDDIKTWFTLRKDGVLSEEGTAEFVAPTGMEPDEGYDEGAWNPELPEIVDKDTYDVFTYEYEPIYRTVTYNVLKEGSGNVLIPDITTYQHGDLIGVDPNGGIWDYEGTKIKDRYFFNVYEDKTLQDPTREGYVFVGWKEVGGTGDVISIFMAQWEVDKNADGIPDRYQKVITFKVENGIWEDGTKDDIKTWFTLRKDGVLSEEGTAEFVAPTGMEPDEGYDEGAWNPELPEIVDKETYDVFTYEYEPIFKTVTYNVLKEGSGNVLIPDITTYQYGDLIGVDPNGGIWDYEGTIIKDRYFFNVYEDKTLQDPTREGYVFVGWKEVGGIGDVISIFMAQWEVDENADGIPDRYQKVITFKVENGIWEDGTKDDIKTWFTLRKNGVLSEEGTAEFVAPTGMEPDEGYDEGAWNPELPELVDKDTYDVFTYEYEPIYRTVTYNVLKEGSGNVLILDRTTYQYGDLIGVDPNGGIWDYEGTIIKDRYFFNVYEDKTLQDPTREGYVFVGWKEVGGTGDVISIFMAQWEVDENADKIPDRYQKKVTYKVKNGTWNNKKTANIVEWVTLKDKAGVLSEKGTGTLTKVPTGMIAKAQYGEGAWKVKPATTVTGNAPVKYTYKFKLLKDDYFILAKSYQKGKTKQRIVWTRVKGATNYLVYVGKCNTKTKKYSYKLQANVSANSNPVFVTKKMAKNKTYKVKVVAMKGTKKLATSKVCHTINGKTYKKKYGNVSKIKCTRKTANVGVGRSLYLKTSIKVWHGKKALGKSHAAKFRYLTTNKKIAKVDSKGRIVGVNKGTCKIYIQAVNGRWTHVNVTVK